MERGSGSLKTLYFVVQIRLTQYRKCCKVDLWTTLNNASAYQMGALQRGTTRLHSN